MSAVFRRVVAGDGVDDSDEKAQLIAPVNPVIGAQCNAAFRLTCFVPRRCM